MLSFIWSSSDDKTEKLVKTVFCVLDPQRNQTLILSRSRSLLVLYSASCLCKCKGDSSFWKWTFSRRGILSAAGEELKICVLDQTCRGFMEPVSWNLHCSIRLLVPMTSVLAAMKPYSWLTIRIYSSLGVYYPWFHQMILQHHKSWLLTSDNSQIESTSL